MTHSDWDLFTWLATTRHRVDPIITPALQNLDIPVSVRERFDAMFRANAIATLSAIAETRRVMAALSEIDPTPVIFKGWPLAERIYGAAAQRHTGDLDLLVHPDCLRTVAAILEGLEYQRETDDINYHVPVDAPAMQAEGKDLRYLHAQTGAVTEIHWHLLPFRGWPAVFDHPGMTTYQDTSAGQLHVPSDLGNMLYLPIHGGLHLWTRLKWLADIAWLAHQRGSEQLAHDLAEARRLGIENPVLLGLQLSGYIFGTPLPTDTRPLTGRMAWMARWMTDTMAREDMIPTMTLRYRLWVRIMGLGLASTTSQRLGVLRYDSWRRMRLNLARRQARLQT